MPRIVITIGDPAGVGPEVIDLALASGKIPSGFEIEVLGDRTAGTPGRPDSRSAAAALAALDEAVRRLKEGSADAVVTGPVSKEGLQALGFPFPGQTEYFADAFGVADYGMLLTGDTLSVGLATIHEPLAKVPELLTQESILRIGHLTADFLKRRGIARPKIAVAGLNPHAGENGAFGDEEIRTITPAIARLNATGDAVFSGPAVPDAIFRDAAQGHYHAVLAMYHDQGLIPLKLLDFDTAVNVTLGLPKPRTSPDHGTAFSIAGKNLASPSSMIAAIRLACELA
ncbi:4-hydroxythreonine-4-phosphate dehydrogenase PdxA [Luteolibacter yonseiensis]|uniref:4-hydroxythreonine-4-phosphate dehydrogenase PdxA n=1 Tax=Luteolibacter yonseiensis TaxID=1144680 RepID=A0A934R210_9BACT|nr:4-hydroxythreonine-4-phosphate dehydrogenase PdxA [Luteolibacter yonseiensis]MBK1815369.1 4-hydroxythreonine-4-phosphate dehydrogenase PdxA [Luteolibacter yonseiensis]